VIVLDRAVRDLELGHPSELTVAIRDPATPIVDTADPAERG
jgi:hypothetical protein